MFQKKLQTRRFTFTPYYYHDQEEEEEHPRIHFRRIRQFERPQRRSVLGMIVVALILLWMVVYFTNVKTSSRPMEMQDIQVEEVIVN